MSGEAHFVTAMPERVVQPIEPIRLEAHVQLATPTPEQIRAADGLFAHHKDGELVQGLVGLWSGSLLLHHVAVETFVEDEEEEPEAPRWGDDPPSDEPS